MGSELLTLLSQIPCVHTAAGTDLCSSGPRAPTDTAQPRLPSGPPDRRGEQSRGPLFPGPRPSRWGPDFHEDSPSPFPARMLHFPLSPAPLGVPRTVGTQATFAGRTLLCAVYPSLAQYLPSTVKWDLPFYPAGGSPVWSQAPFIFSAPGELGSGERASNWR